MAPHISPSPMSVRMNQSHSAVSPLSVRVLRFFTEEKEAPSIKKTRFVYDIETCHQETGDVFRAQRRFREFQRLRDGLLAECRHCPDCHSFVERLEQAKLPSRALVVLDAQKYGATRVLQLTHFLTDLINIVTAHARHCKRNGADVDKSVGLFLGVSSLQEAEDAVSSTTSLLGVCKTKQDRLDFRAASMPDFRYSASSLLDATDNALELHRLRGYSAAELPSRR
ncbi:hypothetical protein P43SY_008884 [Pythium insidiosum]|uniref:PX domain-containing protein n=1 Tax=Pythium insidiosum TaxID=114742 RepID=A0AAD5LCR8_PYTIN|nr:hypothetical protein P43SY_008884 [Pythium insidiosum]KAJ0403834.1 hypothetical protein ATCC90586_000500 [Pythium insidiosum]